MGLLVTVKALREQSEQVSRVVAGQSGMLVYGDEGEGAVGLSRQTALVRAADSVCPSFAVWNLFSESRAELW